MGRLPNFLMVGAAKSGTTALYHYLYNHREIFFSKVKEPSFFSAQIFHFPGNGKRDTLKYFTSTFENYSKLFDQASDQKIVGEASTDTMYFPQCIPIIQKYLGNPKILFLLRNPVDRAFSAYGHMVRDNREPLVFEEALKQEEDRIANGWNPSWHYKRCGLYYNQIKSFNGEFDNVKIFIYDDFKIDHLMVVRDVCNFLEIDSTFQPDNRNSEVNVSGAPRIRWFNKIFLMKNPVQLAIRKTASKLMGDVAYSRLRETIRKTNLERMTMNPETKAYLTEYFREDILKLQDLIGRDLSTWLKPN
jgi:hypothetical protein